MENRCRNAPHEFPASRPTVSPIRSSSTDRVQAVIDDSEIHAVNLAEVMRKLVSM